MSAAEPVYAAMAEAIRNDEDAGALLTAVYSIQAPDSATLPFVTLGGTGEGRLPRLATAPKRFTGEVRVHWFTVYPSADSSTGPLAVAGMLTRILDGPKLTLDEGYVMTRARFETLDVFKDPEIEAHHGVGRYQYHAERVE